MKNNDIYTSPYIKTWLAKQKCQRRQTPLIRTLAQCPVAWVKLTLKAWVRASSCRKPNLTNELCLSWNHLPCNWDSEFCLRFVNVDLDEADRTPWWYQFNKSVRVDTKWLSTQRSTVDIRNFDKWFSASLFNRHFCVPDLTVDLPSFLVWFILHLPASLQALPGSFVHL